ncbi:MAG: hypothetical protein JSS63_06615 [Bacteroidetes bacterium]|nr:hypothetical protein [Bacteroidota bacterium]MBX7044648.1 hypothetical protein [Ignavibacteria bacterium]
MNIYNRNLFFSLLVFFFFIQKAFPQSDNRKPKTNLENIDALLESSFELLGDRLILNKEKVYLLEINAPDNETESYFKSKIKSRFADYKIISDANLGSDAKIVIDSLALDTKYLRLFEKDLLGNKYIKRQATVKYYCSVLITNVQGYRFNQSFTDDFALDDLSLVESDKFFFAQGVIPPQSFFSKYLVPSLVILASAAAVILFFTVRNK